MILLNFFLLTLYLSLSVVQAGYGPEMYAHPKPDTYKKWWFWTVQPTLINYKLASDESVEWTTKLDSFLAEYYKPITSGSRQTCDHFTSNTNQVPCDVDMNVFGPCSKENLYGYHRGRPCIFLSLEKKDGWIPEFYNNDNNLPEVMPSHTKMFIKGKADMSNRNSTLLNNVWVSCEGETSADVENLGPISYFPAVSFPGYYFPYVKNQPNYLSPLVAIELESPVRGIVISVRCKAWAKNIHHCTENRLGTVSFDILID